MGGYRHWTDIVPHRVSLTISDLACRFYLRSDGSGGSGGDEGGMARGETACGGEVHSGWMGFPDSCSTTTLRPNAPKRRIIELNRRRGRVTCSFHSGHASIPLPCTVPALALLSSHFPFPPRPATTPPDHPSPLSPPPPSRHLLFHNGHIRPQPTPPWIFIRICASTTHTESFKLGPNHLGWR